MFLWRASAHLSYNFVQQVSQTVLRWFGQQTIRQRMLWAANFRSNPLGQSRQRCLRELPDAATTAEPLIDKPMASITSRTLRCIDFLFWQRPFKFPSMRLLSSCCKNIRRRYGLPSFQFGFLASQITNSGNNKHVEKGGHRPPGAFFACTNKSVSVDSDGLHHLSLRCSSRWLLVFYPYRHSQQYHDALQWRI